MKGKKKKRLKDSGDYEHVNLLSHFCILILINFIRRKKLTILIYLNDDIGFNNEYRLYKNFWGSFASIPSSF
ncbi:MAG: hypothetical protein K6253_02855, partial [Candidatus Liberibacter asiaticus]|nr:hypothetical protein [Candidatus Liberibacter asiaticus]